MENHNSFVVTHCRRVSGVFMRNSAVSYILVIIHLRGYKSDRTLRFVWTPGLSIVLKNTQKNPLLNAPEPGTGTPLIRLQVTCSTRLSSFSGTDIPLQQGHGRQWEDQGSGRRMPAHRHLAGDPWERDRERELRIRAFRPVKTRSPEHGHPHRTIFPHPGSSGMVSGPGADHSHEQILALFIFVYQSLG